MVLTYVRDNQGIPTGYVVVDLAGLGIRQSVHSLGTFMDDYVDRFGLTNVFVERLWKLRTTCGNCADFVDKLQPHPAREAEWFWDMIKLTPRPVFRVRETIPKAPTATQ